MSIVNFIRGQFAFKRRRLVVEHSSQLPDEYNQYEIYKILAALEFNDLLGKYLHWSEIGAIGFQEGVVPFKKLSAIQAVLAYPFYMLEPGEPLIVGEYELHPPKKNMSESWYKAVLHEPNIPVFRSNPEGNAEKEAKP